MINVGFGVGFDPRGRPVVHYHNYDPNGHSQTYLARWENDAWAIRPVSRWQHRWDFQGGGSINVELSAGPVHLLPDERLVQSWSHLRYGSGAWVLDPDTLAVTGTTTLPRQHPAELSRPTTRFPGLGVRWESDEVDGANSDGRYVLRWESLGANRDRPRTGPLPEPTMLTLYRLASGQ